jgi:hypothetical protein
MSGAQQVGLINVETSNPTTIPTSIEKMDRFDVMFMFADLD